MTDRTVEEIQAEIIAVRREHTALREREYQLTGELRDARIRDGENAPHPWAGKKVVLPPGGWQPRAQRGVVVLGDGKLRGLIGIRPRPGEWYVRSAGGAGKRCDQLPPFNPETGKCGRWELDE